MEKGDEGMSTEWEYDDFIVKFNWHQKWGLLWSGEAIRSEVWQRYQTDILSSLQKWLDDGWQAVSDVGPAAINIVEGPPNRFLGFYPLLHHNVEIVDLRIKMRRQRAC